MRYFYEWEYNDDILITFLVYVKLQFKPKLGFNQNCVFFWVLKQFFCPKNVLKEKNLH